MDKKITKINIIRAISCIAVLLYHIGILKGGYLAVCTFFVLTGYLSIISNNKKEFKIKEYYKKRFIKVYCPILIIVFTTLTIITFLSNITYLNYKREILSILFGYNNYWQLHAQLDYFTRHVSSPFMHLWYIAIILQFDLLFPFLWIGIKTIKKHLSNTINYMILFLIGIISYILFYKTTKDGNLMSAYYGTLTRIYSIILGMILGLFHSKYKPAIIRNKVIGNLLFYIYIIIILLLFFFIDFKSNYYIYSMLLVPLLTLRLIDYSKLENKSIKNDKIMELISKISYEVYLVQYPVIFIFQNSKSPLKIPIIILLTLILSIILHLIFDKKKNKILRIIFIILFSLFSIFGFYTFIKAKDNTKEMKKLEADLKQNQLIIEKRQKEFEKRKKQEESDWNNVLSDLENSEKDLENKVRNMSIIGIGDSIMELAVNDLMKEFPNGYFDAKTNRRPSQVNELLEDLINRNLLGDVVLFNIGTNGEFYPKYTDKIMETLGNRKVFWVNATNADYDDFNDRLNTLAEKYSNVKIIDWVSVANAHPEYLISDKVHPTVYGCKIYANTLFNGIYEEFKKEFQEQKEKKLQEHNKEEQEKITFIGNDLLSGLYETIEKEYQTSDFIIESKINYSSLKKILKETKCNHNIILLFDKQVNITNEEYSKLLKDYQDYNIIIIDIDDTIEIDHKNVTVMKMKNKLENDSYRVDGIHLNSDGNKILKKEIEEFLKKE